MSGVPKVFSRFGMAGLAVLLTGSTISVVASQQLLSGPALADTPPFELFCANTPIGNLVFNDAVVSGSLSVASPSAGQTFNLSGLQIEVPTPSAILSEASSLGVTSITSTVNATISATGATPASMPTGALSNTGSVPNPVPASGGTLTVPSSPTTLGPFSATSSNIALSLAPSLSLTIAGNGIPVGLPAFGCSAYPNGVMTAGFSQAIPPGLPISPVIASAGTPPPPPPTTETDTGPYELYCPHTPVGDLDFNDVTTSATVSPSSPGAGSQFNVTDYQTVIPLPSGVVSAAAGLGNSSFVGLAASNLEAYGAFPAQIPSGSMGFDLSIPDPVPSGGLALDVPSSPTTVGPFTAVGGALTIAEDQSILVVAELSGKAFKMTCTAYPNDSIATSGSTSTPPSATPIRPVIAVASAPGTPVTPPNPGGPGVGIPTPTGPYELYCPSTPVGDIAVNDVVTTASISPSSINEGDQFTVSGVQTQFTLPQGIVQQAEKLGLTSLSGDLLMFLNVTGTEYGGYPYPVTSGSTGSGTVVTGSATATASSGSGSSSGSSPPTTTPPVVVVPGPYPYPPYPFPGPGFVDLSFNVTLPSTVPAGGVQFTAAPAPDYQAPTFVAAGGPIQVLLSGANLDVTAFGDQFGLFCDTLANDSVPTGLSIQEPYSGLVEPLIATATATTNPPPPTPVGPQGPYELFCPGSPIGQIAFNDVSTTGTISPADPAAGQTFNLSGYQTTVDIPSSIAAAAAALGSDLSGTVTAAVDATGASPAQVSTGALSFDVPLAEASSSTGVTLEVPSNPTTVGPFVASGGTITVAQDASAVLDIVVGGIDLTLKCIAYPNDTLPSGVVGSFPTVAPMSPEIASTGASAPPSPTTSIPPVVVPPNIPGSSSGAGVTTSSGSSGSSSSGGTSVTGGLASSGGSSGAGAGGSQGTGGASSSALAETGSSAQTPSVSATSGSLAFTGFGSATMWMAVAGGALMLIGIGMLTIADAPRRLLRVFAVSGGHVGGRSRSRRRSRSRAGWRSRAVVRPNGAAPVSFVPEAANFAPYEARGPEAGTAPEDEPLWAVDVSRFLSDHDEQTEL
jgi:hypothetical protein